MSNSLDPGQARQMSSLIWVQPVCIVYQQATSQHLQAMSHKDDYCRSLDIFVILF